jgi:hypothetical protein
MFLHLIGEGGILDGIIKSYLSLGDKFITFYIPSFVFYGYIILLFYLAGRKIN